MDGQEIDKLKENFSEWNSFVINFLSRVLMEFKDFNMYNISLYLYVLFSIFCDHI